MTMKYKIGDKVKIKNRERIEEEYGDIDYAGMTDGMEIKIRAYFPKRILTIKEVDKVGDCYLMEEMDNYKWIERTIEGLYKEPTYVKETPINSRFEILDLEKR